MLGQHVCSAEPHYVAVAVKGPVNILASDPLRKHLKVL